MLNNTMSLESKVMFRAFRVLLCPFVLCWLVPTAWAAESLEDGVAELAQEIVEKSQAENKHTIAVAAFPHADRSLSVLSNYLVDELVLALFAVPNNNLQIVERSQLESIFEEMELNSTGRVDLATARELGNLHGVDALVVGSITTIGDRVRVIARLIETDTGRVFSSAATTIPKTETTTDLMNQKLVDQPLVQGHRTAVATLKNPRTR